MLVRLTKKLQPGFLPSHQTKAFHGQLRVFRYTCLSTSPPIPGQLELTRRSCLRGLVHAGGLYERRHRFDDEAILRARLEIVGGVIRDGDRDLVAGFPVALDNRVVGYAFRMHRGRLPS